MRFVFLILAALISSASAQTLSFTSDRMEGKNREPGAPRQAVKTFTSIGEGVRFPPEEAATDASKV